MRDKGIWLFFVIILSEGNKVDIFAVAQKSDIFQVHAKSVIGGDGYDERLIVSDMRLCGHEHRCVGNAVCKLGGSVSGARKNGKHVKKRLWTDRLRILDGGNRFFSGDFPDFCDICVRFSKTAFD